jgi:SAM-dependent methyltransferase
VDRWEDERLAELLGPLVNGRSVLDLGCGTGWLLDHCGPLSYVGVDASGPMLAELGRKHPRAITAKARVGAPGWTAVLAGLGPFDVITATWSLEYLGDLGELMPALFRVTARPAVIALHGSTPRGHRRAHFSVKEVPSDPITPFRVRAAAWRGGAPTPEVTGTSALPDAMMGAGRWAFRAALALPASLHYSALWTWQL